MDARMTPITAFAQAVATQRPAAIEAAIKVAYHAGVQRETLLMAVDVARAVTHVPEVALKTL